MATARRGEPGGPESHPLAPWVRRGLVVGVLLAVLVFSVRTYPSLAYTPSGVEERSLPEGSFEYSVVREKRWRLLPGRARIEVPLTHLEFVDHLLEDDIADVRTTYRSGVLARLHVFASSAPSAGSPQSGARDR